MGLLRLREMTEDAIALLWNIRRHFLDHNVFKGMKTDSAHSRVVLEEL